MDKAWAATVKTPTVGRPRLEDGQGRPPPSTPSWTRRDSPRSSPTRNREHPRHRGNAARELAWVRRCEAGDQIDVSALKLGRAHVLFMPGELFVEYQLAAQKIRPDLFVAMAAYGEYGPGYIGVEATYPGRL